MSYTIRPARLEDAEASCIVRIQSWRETYHAMMPQKILDDLNLEENIARFRASFEDKKNPAKRFVAEMNHRIVGIGTCGPWRKTGQPQIGEIYAIYFLKKAQGKGLGRALMREMARHLVSGGASSLLVHVLRDNTPARKFYERLGGIYAGDDVFTTGDAALPEVFYRWDDVTPLLKMP